MPVIPMGPPPSGAGGASFSIPGGPQHAGPPGPPTFSSQPRPSPPPDMNARPSNFAEIPLAPHSAAPPADNGLSSRAGHPQRALEEEFDAYSLSASAPFVLFSAQKVAFIFTIRV